MAIGDQGVLPQHHYHLGNNVFAQENWEGQNAYASNYRPAPAPEWRSTMCTSPMADALEDINAPVTVTQLFYTNTTSQIHELYYYTGIARPHLRANWCDKVTSSGTTWGAELANAQDGSGYNDASFFVTPPNFFKADST
ncbi:hypothetical protein B0H12DRAFT_304983 [Mycena haematopus]|nr:hypothetical protein B0H12DRAFT_304983 [Mycena haematopus]